MVFVKVRETYDLHTTKNKMSVIGIHTPKPDIIKRNFPGLLLQCRAYRPVSCDVKIACASVLPLDPQGVGLAEGDVAPEDVFNPILYKAISNKGMSQLEARLTMLARGSNFDVSGSSADVEVDSFTNNVDEFNLYYGLLSNARGWKHASPQRGLSMRGLKPYVYDLVTNVPDIGSADNYFNACSDAGAVSYGSYQTAIGKAKKFPFLNCTAYTADNVQTGFPNADEAHGDFYPYNHEGYVPYILSMCGVIIIPPSRLHELFYRMVVEWTIEFSSIRQIGEVGNWNSLITMGNFTHLQNYSYEATKEAITGDKSTVMDNDMAMVSTNVDIEKVM